jgi:hypothetical protein
MSGSVGEADELRQGRIWMMPGCLWIAFGVAAGKKYPIES